MGCDQETVRAAEKIILPGDRDRLGCVTQIRVRATCQRDEFSLCTSKFESDMASHAVGLADCGRVFPVRRHVAGGRSRRPDIMNLGYFQGRGGLAKDDREAARL